MPGFGDSLPGQTCDGRWQTLYHRAVSVNKQKQRRCESPGCSNPYPHLHTPGTVTMDFVEGLPMSRGYSCIMVVVDKLTRYAHFIPLAHPFSAIQVASIFMQQIYKHHGLPYAIVSDRDRVFTSTLWRELFKLAGTELRMSSAYHPQTDGTTERVNQCMETYLRCFVHSCPHKWFQWLHLAEFWYNTSAHSALKASPFEVLYGHPPRHFGIVDASASAPADLATWLHEREVMIALLKQHLERSKQRMKEQADKKRSERSFAMGDWVYVKLQPYVQVSVAPRANHKLFQIFLVRFRSWRGWAMCPINCNFLHPAGCTRCFTCPCCAQRYPRTRRW